ncbi:hypothetical protein [Methylobacterium sp. SyP6R]|uniref:hypothetical protein n=1 Tax=Methylobacterium sp. SyP6R TaxID=2718876 RepID=UPI001F4356F6|nr:hypothetical protein [Methylobacterium sp. SyP6R]MCF4129219.1 hypothetical protein [Methylobacterium sp. SyP6R]
MKDSALKYGRQLVMKLFFVSSLSICSIWAFTKSLESYSRYLEKSHIDLDVKGVVWSAAFPAPNVTVPVDQKHADVSDAQIGLQDHESVEAGGDKEPSKYEFLGKEIDAGFRVAKHAGPDRLALSLEVAYLLSCLCSNGEFNFSFRYGGREGLKGVIFNRPYPIIALDTERRAFRREVRAFEQAISGDKDAQPHLLKTFLDAFMRDEGIEFPFLPRKNEAIKADMLPRSYQDFKKYWPYEKKEDVQRVKVEVQGENEEAVRTLDAEIPVQDPESRAIIEENRAMFFKK